MKRLKIALLAGIAAWAIGIAGATAFAQSPQATGQYGYGGPTAPPQGGPSYTCQPSPTCQNVTYGCQVTVCNCPCNPAWTCKEINDKIPGIHNPPTCHEAQVCEIIDEGPPTAQCQWVNIYRNCYVPIKIKKVPGPSNVTPINIQVNWREVHVLCDSTGAPIPSAQAAAILKELNESMAKSQAPGAGSSGTTVAPSASQSTAPAPAAPAQDQPSASATVASASAPAQASSPTKQWVWLAQEGVYGYGYQRPDGLWEIEPGSRRPTL
jgi:hypothetical protein